MRPQDFDRFHLIHPYANPVDGGPAHFVREAEGVWLVLDDGTRMIDAMSSWWSTIHGHRHPQITAAMQRQLHRMPHVMFGGLTHAPAVELGRKLLGLLPAGLEHVFYCDSGSVSVEVALKMALQAQRALGSERTSFATIRGGYHGDTWKAMSLCDPVTGMHGHFGNALRVEHFLPPPPIGYHEDWDDDPHRNGTAALEALFDAKGHEIAALIVEPVVQGAGGMRFYHPDWLRAARDACDRHGVLLIFDEIATGFGRTGTLFAMNQAEVVPDILCLGKALTGGHLSFAATIAHARVASAIAASDPGIFMHGPTFMANPLACAAASASLDLLATGAWQPAVWTIEDQLRAELEAARELPTVADVRVCGAIGVIELNRPAASREIHALCREWGVWLRPFGRLIYTMQPYICRPDEVSRITAAMRAAAAITT